MPARTENFVFRISPQERALINQMAEQMSRKPGDAARLVVLTTAKEMINDGEKIKLSNRSLTSEVKNG